MKAYNMAALAALAIVMPAAGAQAQQAAPANQPAAQAPRRATVVVPAGESTFDVSLTVQGPEAASYLGVKATNADVRELFREMGQRSGATVLIAPSASGRVTIDMPSQPVGKAMDTVAKRAGLSVLRIVVSESQAAGLTPEGAGILAEAMTTMPLQAVMTDPATGRTLAVAEKKTADAVPSGFTAVYYLQGTQTPEQERLARERRTAEQSVKTAQAAVDPKQTDVTKSAIQMLGRLPVQQRMEAFRNMQREMFNNLTPQERAQLRGNRDNNGRDRRRGR